MVGVASRCVALALLNLVAWPATAVAGPALATASPVPAAPQDSGITWESLPELMELGAANGLSGSILAVRDGEVVLEQGYGYADPAKQHKVTPETLFAIGSTPIDFTHGAILKLAELGKLSLSDPVAMHLDPVLKRAGKRGGLPDGVPADKRGLTLEHLRSGRSGLLDFPGLPGVDANLDLAWIDRQEFLRRVLTSELLFEPGARAEHSHAAWGVLAAVVEIASGQDYEAFLREHFFEPAGMQRTGNYPLAARFPAGEVAVGLGGNLWGEVNAPSHWGPTSWLVMGSGGMVSTPRDLYRWREFLRGGEVLTPESLGRYGVAGPNLFEGGNDRGFINTIGFHGDSMVVVCSNSQVELGDTTAQISMAAAEVGAGPPPPGMERSGDDGGGTEGGMVTDRGPRPGVDFELRTGGFVLQPLHPRHVELDYKACMDNREHLRAALGWGGWPQDDMTLEGDRGDLERHFGEFERDEAYALAVLTPSLDEITGCVYINRDPKDPQAVSVAYWVVEQNIRKNTDKAVVQEVLNLIPAWGFKRAVFPVQKSYARGVEVLESFAESWNLVSRARGEQVLYSWQAR